MVNRTYFNTILPDENEMWWAKINGESIRKFVAPVAYSKLKLLDLHKNPGFEGQYTAA
jgi:hypothetical protein